jgi:hypothetical protein
MAGNDRSPLIPNKQRIMQMHSALQDVPLKDKNILVVMPLSRVLVEERLRVGMLTIYPPGELNLEELGVQVDDDSSDEENKLQIEEYIVRQNISLRDMQIMILFISFINVRLETMGYTVRDNSLHWSRGASET